MLTSNPSLVRFIGIAVGITGLWIASSQAQRQREPLTMEKVSPHLYVIYGNGGNVGVMPTSEGVILVDDKFERDVPEILAKVKTISDKPVRYVLSTHQHGDHVGSNDLFRSQNAEIIMHKNSRANMVALKQPGLSQIAFNDETRVFLGGMEVQARFLGAGHTNGDAVMYFPTDRVLHAGDLFVSDDEAPIIDAANGGSIKEWDKTVEKALQYDFDIVIPGHGPVAKREDLVKWIQTLGKVRGMISEACKGGADGAYGRLNLKAMNMVPRQIFIDNIPRVCQEFGQ